MINRFVWILVNCLFVFGASLAFGQADQPSSAAGPYQIARTIPVGGDDSWDYVTIDEKGQTLYLTRVTHTLVVDIASGKTLGDIPGNTRNHGVALVPDLGRGFITDGDKGEVTVFDLKTYAVLGHIPAAPDADGIIYDPSTKKILVACGDDGSLLVISPDVDPANGKIDGKVDLAGKPEFLAADGKGIVYVNVSDKAEVVAVDIKAIKVVSRWSIAPGATSTGLSIDRDNGRLFVGCRNKHFIVLSTKDGSVLGDFPIGTGVDATVFDAGYGMASCGDGTLTIVKETSPGKFEVVQTLKTAASARTMAVDHNTGKVYLAAAEMKAPVGGGRVQPVAGTYKILVAEKAAGQ